MPAELRILLATDCVDAYGAERWNLALVRGLLDRGHSVGFAQPRTDSEVTTAIAALGVDRSVLSPLTEDDPHRPFRPDGPASLDHDEARRSLDALRPDVVVCSDGEPGSNLAMKEVALGRGLPVVVVAHLGLDADAKERAMPPSVQERIGAVHRRAAAVVGVSAAGAASLAAAYDLAPARVHVVPNGRPPSWFAPADPAVRAASRRSLGVVDDQVLFCTLARPHPNKRYSIQIDALRSLASAPGSDRLRFAWAGGGPGLERLRFLVRANGLDPLVSLVGHLTDPAPLLAAADAFVLASAREGMPLAVIEAMAAGLPVVATDVGGVAEALGDTGVLLPDPALDRGATVVALERAIVALAGDPARRAELGTRARARAVERFGEAQMIDRYDALLRSVATAS